MGRAAQVAPAAHPARWTLGAGWVVATVIGEVTGIAAILGLLMVFGDFDPAELPTAWILLAAAAGLLYGSVVGLAQWIVIRRVQPGARLWTLAGMASWTMAGVVFALLERSMGGWSEIWQWYERMDIEVQAGIVALTVGALLSALLQWFILRRHVPGSGWWLVLLPAAMLPWILGDLAGVGVVIWFVLQPAVSGVLLVLLFRRASEE